MKKIIFVVSIFCLAMISCQSAPIDLSEEYSAEQLIQKGQERFNMKDYKNAILCYEEVINRYGDDLEHYIEARYEIGRIELTRKNYDIAYGAFSEILNMYSSTEIGTIPPAFRKLAAISISQIPENKLPPEASLTEQY